MRSELIVRLCASLFLPLAVATAHAAPAQCTPGSCDDNNPCTVDTCDPVQGCIYTPTDCDDGSVCTVDTCLPAGGIGVATIFLGHDINLPEHQYQKNGTLIQTWGAVGAPTAAAFDGGNVYIVNPNYVVNGSNVFERRGPGDTNLGTFAVAVNNQWIEDLGNYTSGFVLAGTIEGDVWRINTANGAFVLMFSTGQSFVGVTFDGTDIWTTGGYTSTLVHRRNLAGTVLSTFNTGRMNAGIGYDPDDGTLWIGHPNGQVTHYTASGTLLGGFTTAGGGQLIDGLELMKLALAPGCQNAPVSCSDGDFCTDDACDPATGCNNPPHSCDDTNPCTDDTCSTQTGCVTTNNTAPCEDSNLCTAGDTCSGGACQPGPVIVCNDNNPCTTDSCDPRFGCTFVNTNGFCNDGNACTLEDTCVGGVCQPGFPVVCNDNNACTADSCIPAQGCVYVSVPPGSTCDDNDACTHGDTCVNGTCQGAPTVCAAPDQCHLAGTCDPLSGTCTNPPAPDGTTCNDGNPCTVADHCVNGVCAGTTVGVPAETQNVAATADKATFFWSPSSEATGYDAVRGSTAAFPVGSSSTGEVCFHDLTAAKLVDPTPPASGAGFWYIVRPRNPCGWGPWGTQSNGVARVTGVCP